MTEPTIDVDDLISRYAEGPSQLQTAIGDLPDSLVRTRVAPGRWSVLEVVCHLSDFELVYADRLKRVIAEDRPTLFGGDPDLFAARLAYQVRDLQEELQVIASVRRQVTRFLRTLEPGEFGRIGVHSSDGPLTMQTLLKRITGHIPHHADLIRQKRLALMSG